VEFAVVAQPLDGGDLAALQLLSQQQAGQGRLAVHKHRAHPALPQLAAVLGPHQPQVLPQDLQEGAVRWDEHPVVLAVDPKPYRPLHPHPPGLN
jgi:hypothetical protein